MFTGSNYYSREYVYQYMLVIYSWIFFSAPPTTECVKSGPPHTRREYYNFSSSRFTTNREVPAVPDNVGAFLGRQRLAHFKIDRKHRGKCLALIRVDFSLYPTTNFLLRVQGDALFVPSSVGSRRYYPSRLITLYSEMAVIFKDSYSSNSDQATWKWNKHTKRCESYLFYSRFVLYLIHWDSLVR